MLSNFLLIPPELTLIIKLHKTFNISNQRSGQALLLFIRQNSTSVRAKVQLRAMQEVEPALSKHLNARGRRLSVFSSADLKRSVCS